jgi:hypothetical protein
MTLGVVMQDDDTRLDAVVFRSSQGHCADGALLLVVFDPSADVLVNEYPHFRRPGLDTGACASAFVQGDDELGPLAVSDVEGPGFPGVKRGNGGLA